MKTLNKTLVATALLGSALVSGAASAEQKIAVVNVQGILQAMPKAATVQQDIAAEFKDQTEAVERLQGELEYQVQKLQREAATMSEAQKKELEEKILKTRDEYAAKAQPLKQAIERRFAEERNKMLGLIRQAMDAVAAKGNYDLVLNAGAVAFAKPEHDLSEQVLEQVNKTK